VGRAHEPLPGRARLHVPRPRAPREVALRLQLGKLRRVVRVCAAPPQPSSARRHALGHVLCPVRNASTPQCCRHSCGVLLPGTIHIPVMRQACGAASRRTRWACRPVSGGASSACVALLCAILCDTTQADMQAVLPQRPKRRTAGHQRGAPAMQPGRRPSPMDSEMSYSAQMSRISSQCVNAKFSVWSRRHSCAPRPRASAHAWSAARAAQWGRSG